MDSNGSCLSDSGESDSDEAFTPKPGMYGIKLRPRNIFSLGVVQSAAVTRQHVIVDSGQGEKRRTAVITHQNAFIDSGVDRANSGHRVPERNCRQGGLRFVRRPSNCGAVMSSTTRAERQQHVIWVNNVPFGHF